MEEEKKEVEATPEVEVEEETTEEEVETVE